MTARTEMRGTRKRHTSVVALWSSNGLPVDKSPDAFRTISEVAAQLDLPQHVLRFWETRFSQIKPLKRGGGRRYYRPDDVDLLSGIRKLLYGEGYTIKGVQRLLKENGVHWVMDVGRGIESGAPAGTVRDDGFESKDGGGRRGGVSDDARSAALGERREVPQVQGPTQHRARVHADEQSDAERAPGQPSPAQRAYAPLDEPLPRDVLDDDDAPETPRSGLRLMERLRGESRDASLHPVSAALSQDDVRRLQATLFELLECKRILDSAR